MLILAILFFVILVVIHEYGHYLVARRNGVEAEEFGIGFPPKIWGKKMGRGIFRTYYSINSLPLGGFVKLKGESDEDTAKGSYGAASFWVKTKIILAGVLVNFFAAILIFTILAMIGMPKMVDDQFSLDSKQSLRNDVAVASIEESSPADNILQEGDILVNVAGNELEDAIDLKPITEANAGKTIDITYTRDNQRQTSQIELRDGVDSGFLGVVPADIEVDRYSLLEAPVVGVGLTLQLAKLTYQGLANTFSNLFTANFSEAADTVAGPIGVVSLLGDISSFGFNFLLYFIAVISLTLAIINALPIPALDGGRWFVSALFKILRRPLTKNTEQLIHGAGFVLLMLLIVLISIADVNRFL